MLNPADVTKVKCNFVSKVLAFLAKRHYTVNVCPCELATYYKEYAYTTILEDCLEYEQECAINNNSYVAPTECDDTIANCSDQTVVTLTSSVNSCGLLGSTINLLNNSSYPTMFVTDNSPRVNGSIALKVVKASGGCSYTTSYTTVLGGRTSTGGVNDQYQSEYLFGFANLSSFTGSSATTISILRVYETDTLGTLINTPINLDLNPTTSVYYSDNVDCPGCTALLAADLEIGNASFESNFQTLMDNVSIARYGEVGHHSMSASSNGSGYNVRCQAYHNPIQHFGINSSNPYILLEDFSGSTYSQTKVNTTTITPTRFFYDDTTYSPDGSSYDCANLTPVIGDQYTYPVYKSSTSFNKIELTTPFAQLPIVVTSDGSSNCSITLLTASYDPTNVVSVAWYSPSDDLLSATAYAVADDPGTYTFEITVESTSGTCSHSSTIIIES